MTHSETTGAIAAALAKAQSAMAGATKDAKNPHFNSKYADLASIRDACQKPLAENEIAVVQSASADANLVRMVTTLLHSSGEWLRSDMLQVQARDANPQAVGSCLTYLRRYQLAAMVGVAPEDDDAEAAEARPAPKVTSMGPHPPDTNRMHTKTSYEVQTSEWDDDGPDRVVDMAIDMPDVPPGFALIDNYKPDGDWHKFLWRRDAHDGAAEYKTKLGHIAEAAIDAYRAKVPVKLHSKKLPFLDKVEVWGGA